MSRHRQELGARLVRHRDQTSAAIYQVGESFHLAWSAFDNVSKSISAAETQTISISVPIGRLDDGQALFSDPFDYQKEVLAAAYREMADQGLPLTCVYHFVTIAEGWMNDLVRLICLAYPKKLGGKRQVALETILSLDSIDAIHLASTDCIVNDLSYKTPVEFSEEFRKIADVDLRDIPQFWTYCEIKATRDIWIHNRGVANEIYARKAGPRARVAPGRMLPVNIQYFLECYDTILRLVSAVHRELADSWPAPAPSPPEESQPTVAEEAESASSTEE